MIFEFLTASGLTLGLQLGFYTEHPEGSQRRIIKTESPGIYVKSEDGFILGGYRNGERKISIYSGWQFETSDGVYAVALGGVTGYSRGSVVPLIIPSVRLYASDTTECRTGNCSEVRLSFYIPKLERNRTNAIRVMLEKTF